jgi:hypothetical protein
MDKLAYVTCINLSTQYNRILWNKIFVSFTFNIFTLSLSDVDYPHVIR